MNKAKIIKQGAFVLFLWACIIFYMLTMLPQDITLLEYKEAFSGIKHPTNTKFVQRSASLGSFDKTRVMYKEDFPQGCDYSVGEIRGYSGSKEVIQAFYAVQKVIISNQEKPISLLFIPTNAQGIIDPESLTRDESIAIGPLDFQTLEDLRGDQYFHFLNLDPSLSYYLVSLNGFSLTDSDIRCQF